MSSGETSSDISMLKESDIDEELNTFLTLHRVAETEEGNKKRNRLVKELEVVFKCWVEEVGTKNGMKEEDCKDGAGASLFVFGSQRLGVHAPDADIDILCCGPSFTCRYGFFSSFLEKLKDMSNVTDVLPLPDAYTPVIKLTLGSFSVDLVFVSLTLSTIPEDIDLLDNNYLVKLDEVGIRSLNGVRVAERILQLVPDKETFAVALRTIKHWAIKRGIYSNVMGFLGGVSYAILTAFVCQQHPQACASKIIHQFFLIFSQWRWPAPVFLAAAEEIDHEKHPDIIGMSSWNPQLCPTDGYHLMPIITPAVPSMNSAFNVGIPQFRMIQLEIQRGVYLFQSMNNIPNVLNSEKENSVSQKEHEERQVQPRCRKSSSSKTSFFPHSILWNTITASCAFDFFHHFQRFIQVDIMSQSREEQSIWFGWCESRLKHLFLSIEQTHVVYCHPNATCFRRDLSVSNCKADEDSKEMSHRKVATFFIGLSFPEGPTKIDLKEIGDAFMYRVCSWVGKTSSMELSLKSIESKELPDFLDIDLPSRQECYTPRKVFPQGNQNKSTGHFHYATPLSDSMSKFVKGDVTHGSKSHNSCLSGKCRVEDSESTPKLASLVLNSVKDSSKSGASNVCGLHSKPSFLIEKKLFDDESTTSCACGVDQSPVNSRRKEYQMSDADNAIDSLRKGPNDVNSGYTDGVENSLLCLSSPHKRVRPN